MRCICSELDCPFVPCYEEVEYEKDVWTHVQCYDGQPSPRPGRSLAILFRGFVTSTLPKAPNSGCMTAT